MKKITLILGILLIAMGSILSIFFLTIVVGLGALTCKKFFYILTGISETSLTCTPIIKTEFIWLPIIAITFIIIGVIVLYRSKEKKIKKS